MMIADFDYQQSLKLVREVVLDISPVQCFKVSGQGFVFSKDSSGIVVDTETFTFAQMQKQYDLLYKLREKEISVEILPDYIATGDNLELTDFNFPDLNSPRVIEKRSYFPLSDIDNLYSEYFMNYIEFDGVPKTVESIFNQLDYLEKRRLVLWVAYYLVDRKRMYYASSSEMIRLQSSDSGGSCGNEGTFKNTDTSITTRIGDVFSMTEKIDESGKGLEGFTSLWGDKYSYLSKLQLWIRDRFEKQFKDYSLRDNAMISQSFSLEKAWRPYQWTDSLDYIGSSDILNPPR